MPYDPLLRQLRRGPSTALPGGPPTGPAGGDLGGTYPNPTVLKINGVPFNADPLVQYWKLGGRAGGQVGFGGTAAGESATIASTANATKGSIFFGTSGLNLFNEVTGQLLINTASDTDVGGLHTRLLVVATADGRVNSSGHSLHVQRYGAGVYPVLKVIRFEGTFALPTAVLNGDLLGSVEWAGEDGSGTGNDGIVSSAFRAVATENWGIGANGADMQLFLTPTGTTGAVAKFGFAQTGRLGINTLVYLGVLSIVEDLSIAGSTSQVEVIDFYNNTNATGPQWIFRRARGSLAGGGAAVASGDVLLSLSSRGFGATAFASGARAQISHNAAEAWSDTSQGTDMRFFTTPNGGSVTMAEVMRLLGSGVLQLFIGGLETQKLDVALVNGPNNDVAITNRSITRFTGPSANFSVTGFATPSNGHWLIIHNTTTFAMTIANQNPGSLGVNRIITQTGADVVLAAGPSTAIFYYDSTQGRWILLSIRDASGGSSSVPSGPAGGDLWGTYPNPNVQALRLTMFPERGITKASTSNVTPSGGPPSGAAGGDLFGNYPNPSVQALRLAMTPVVSSGRISVRDQDRNRLSAQRNRFMPMTAGKVSVRDQDRNRATFRQSLMTMGG